MPDRTIGRIDWEISRTEKRLSRRPYLRAQLEPLLEKLSAERELAMEEHSVTDIHLVGMSDDELNAKARYYRGKIEATSDPAWVTRWQHRHLAVVREQHARIVREFNQDQKTREDRALAQARWYVLRGQTMPTGFFDYVNAIRARRGMTAYRSNPVLDHIDIQAAGRVLRGPATDGVVIHHWTESAETKREDTMKPGTFETNISIYNPRVAVEKTYPSVRAVLRDRYALELSPAANRSNVTISADEKDSQGQPKFYLEPLSVELQDLGIPHTIQIAGRGRRTLKVEIGYDAFKRLLAALL